MMGENSPTFCSVLYNIYQITGITDTMSHSVMQSYRTALDRCNIVYQCHRLTGPQRRCGTNFKNSCVVNWGSRELHLLSTIHMNIPFKAGLVTLLWCRYMSNLHKPVTSRNIQLKLLDATTPLFHKVACEHLAITPKLLQWHAFVTSLAAVCSL